MAPLVRTPVVGGTRTIGAPSPQGGRTFQSWSDGGARQHNVTVGAADATYTATFSGGPAPPPAPAPTACSPRPPVTVQTAPAGGGRLQVTARAGTSPLLPDNRLRAIRLGAATNALVDVAGRTNLTGNIEVPLPADTRDVTLVVRRASPGAATTVPLVVVDGCGDWPTFVGGGPGAF